MLLTQAFDNFKHVAQWDPIVELISKWTGQSFVELTWWVILIRVLFAVGLGAIIGAERATKSHAAGLRTYILVSLGSAVAMLTNEFLQGNADESRIGAGVLTGIGFIGAGTIIITSRNQVRGLTTAAALWTCAGTGLAFGAGFYTLGLIATVVIVVVVMFMPKIEGKLQVNARVYDIHVELLTRPDLKKLLDFLRSNDIRINSIAYDPAYANSGLSVYSLGLYSAKEGKDYLRKKELMELVNSLEYVNFCESIDQ
jgi:putative Mg2+ transporter-C (MgtC) family protein